MIVICPHCDMLIEIEQLNCGIFRHGIYKNTMKQLEPHAPKNICLDVIEKDMIYGCGGPFKVEILNEEYVVTICDYI